MRRNLANDFLIYQFGKVFSRWIYFERDCGSFGNSLYYRRQGDSEDSSKQKVICKVLVLKFPRSWTSTWRAHGISCVPARTMSPPRTGVNSIMKWLARKAGPDGVLINGVDPGPVQTAMTTSQNFDGLGIPVGRVVQPEEITWPIAVFCFGASS